MDTTHIHIDDVPVSISFLMAQRNHFGQYSIIEK
jgi:hypothetical protein